MKLASLIVKNGILASLLLLAMPASGGTQVNILADGGKVKPSIKIAENYVEKIVSKKVPGESPLREVVSSNQLQVTVVANLGDYDTSGFGSSTELGITFGGLMLDASLGVSQEAVAAGGVFPAGKTKATFLLPYADAGPNDPPSKGSAGKLTFSWGKGKLVVKLNCKSTFLSGIGEVAAVEHKGLYVDETPEGTKPAGSVKFKGAPVFCNVTLDGVSGDRYAEISGVSSTKVKKFGRGDGAESQKLESVKLKGVTGAVWLPE